MTSAVPYQDGGGDGGGEANSSQQQQEEELAAVRAAASHEATTTATVAVAAAAARGATTTTTTDHIRSNVALTHMNLTKSIQLEESSKKLQRKPTSLSVLGCVTGVSRDENSTTHK